MGAGCESSGEASDRANFGFWEIGECILLRILNPVRMRWGNTLLRSELTGGMYHRTVSAALM
jgi:hypothetical protein